MVVCDRRMALMATVVSWDLWYLQSRLYHVLHNVRLSHRCS